MLAPGAFAALSLLAFAGQFGLLSSKLLFELAPYAGLSALGPGLHVARAEPPGGPAPE